MEFGFSSGWPILNERELHFRHLLDKLPAAAYTCNSAGLITYYNPQAAELWGRAPKLNDPADRYSGATNFWLRTAPPFRMPNP